MTPINVEVKADNSCNWKCCFGKKETEVLNSPKSDVVVEETTTKVTKIVERHVHCTPQLEGKKPE